MTKAFGQSILYKKNNEGKKSKIKNIKNQETESPASSIHKRFYVLSKVFYGQKNQMNKVKFLIIIYLNKSAHIGQGDLVKLPVGQEETVFHHEVCISFNLRLSIQPRQNDF